MNIENRKFYIMTTEEWFEYKKQTNPYEYRCEKVGDIVSCTITDDEKQFIISDDDFVKEIQKQNPID